MYRAANGTEHPLRTHAQEIAAKNGNKYDVRTCVDGFPIAMFYQLSADSELHFMGKYNFNNDSEIYWVMDFQFDNENVVTTISGNELEFRLRVLYTKNDDEEFLSYFVGYRPKFSHIRNVREKILSKIEEIKVLTKNYSSKKEIALDNSIPNWDKRFYFNAFDKRENNLELRDWCKLIEMWEATHNESIE